LLATLRATLFSKKIGKSVARNDYLPIFATSKHAGKRWQTEFRIFFIIFILFFPSFFPNWRGFLLSLPKISMEMQLTKDQKNQLKGSLAAWAGMVVAMALFVILGKRTWNDTLWLMLGVTIAEIIVGLFLALGSRVPKEKIENQ
jgi:hypothetical protein